MAGFVQRYKIETFNEKEFRFVRRLFLHEININAFQEPKRWFYGQSSVTLGSFQRLHWIVIPF
jgi:hypothetical protein